MTKRKFQVGDRVRVAKPFKRKLMFKNMTGATLKDVDFSGEYLICLDNSTIELFYGRELEKVE